MHVGFYTPTAPGHVNPELPLVSELVRRGHRVSYAVGRELADLVRAAGADPVPLPSAAPESPGDWAEFDAQALASILEQALDWFRLELPVLRAHFGADRPDLLCFDPINPYGRLVADLFAAPAVAVIPNLAGHPDQPVADIFTSDSFDFADPRLVAAQRAMADFAAANGLGELPDTMNEVPAPLNIVYVPKEFQPGGETFDERYRFVGPSPRREDAGSWRPPETGRPLVFVSLGTAYNARPDFFRMCLEAFADGRWDVALSAGHRVDRAELGPIPSNVDVRPHFPQLAVLERADAFVSHCGMGSTMESLAAGVPLVAAPQVPEQRANARRVEELGLGRVLTDPAPEEIRAAVDHVATDPGIRRNLDAMRRAVTSGGGAVAAADALEEHARRSALA
ncbi:macrolide family glycosyltransferase [Saccharopolyspora taberi]|uniref:Glycosyltransferase n=1 Tax=Saccharopolyspora taberi TaxID=60895 RepID=A0ABN3VFV4_9PSEU